MRTLTISLLLLCACSSPPDDSPAATPPAARYDAATPDDFHVPLNRSEFYGRGLVYFDPFPSDMGRHVIPIRDAPAADAREVAWFVLALPGDHSWRYTTETLEPGLSDNAVEYGYEELGVPFDSITADSSWVRAIYAIDADRTRRTGWIRLERRIGMLRWREWLAERAQYFIDPERSVFHESPGGARVEFRLVRDTTQRLDYHFESDSVAGDWVRVRVTTPSDACGMEVDGVRAGTYWVRAVDEDGRPLVWYFTRGC